MIHRISMSRSSHHLISLESLCVSRSLARYYTHRSSSTPVINSQDDDLWSISNIAVGIPTACRFGLVDTTIESTRTLSSNCHCLVGSIWTVTNRVYRIYI